MNPTGADCGGVSIALDERCAGEEEKEIPAPWLTMAPVARVVTGDAANGGSRLRWRRRRNPPWVAVFEERRGRERQRRCGWKRFRCRLGLLPTPGLEEVVARWPVSMEAAAHVRWRTRHVPPLAGSFGREALGLRISDVGMKRGFGPAKQIPNGTPNFSSLHLDGYKVGEKGFSPKPKESQLYSAFLFLSVVLLFYFYIFVSLFLLLFIWFLVFTVGNLLYDNPHLYIL
ncbi:hypothetical protein VIGAN_05217200, partial [Vigna angularis var. angularis]